MANYFKDLRSGAKNLYRRAKGNATLKGIDDHLDRVSAGGGKGVGDFLLDMSGIADMYQVGKQGAHIADDMYDGKDWDDIDQGRKDALGRGALGTALTLAPVPGIKMARAGLRAGTGAAKRGAQNTFRTAFRDVGARKLLPAPGTAPKGVKRMREALQKNLGKASATGRDRLTRSKAIGKASDKEVRKAYNQLKGIKAPGLGSKYMANASDNIFGKPHGLLKTPLRVATGGGLTGPLYRAGKVGLKDLYRGTPEGYEDSEDILSEIGHPGNPGAQGQAGPDGRGLTMEDYMEMGIDDPQLDAAISGGSAQAMAAAMELSKVKESKILTPENSPDIFHNGGRGPVASGRLGSRGRTSDGAESAYVPGSKSSYDPEAASSSASSSAPGSAPGAPIYDPRRGEYVRAESLTPEERASFADVTAEKDGERNTRLDTHDEKGRLHDNVDRFAIDRQNKARKSWDEIQDGYRRDDDIREIMDYNGISGEVGAGGKPGATGPEVEAFKEASLERSRNLKPSPKRSWSDAEINKLLGEQKVAESLRRQGHIPTAQDLLTGPDNPFREFYTEDYLNQLRREARSDEDYREDAELAGEVPRHELENPAPEMPPLSEPRPIPDDALSFEDELAPHAAYEIAKRDAGPEAAQEMQQSLQNLDLSSELEAGKDLIPGLERLKGISEHRPSESDNEMREIEAMLAAEHGQRVSKGLARKEENMDALWDVRSAWSPEADAAWEQAKQDKYFEEHRHKPYDDFVDESGPTSDHPRWNQEKGSALKPTGWTPTEEEREYDHGFPSHPFPTESGEIFEGPITLPATGDFPEWTSPSSNGMSTTIRDLNNPAGGQEPSIEELIRELEAQGFHR